MRDLDELLGDARSAGWHRARPVPPGEIRRAAARTVRLRAATATIGLAAGAAAVVILGSTFGRSEPPPEVISPPDESAELTGLLLTREDVVDIYSPGGELPWADGPAPEAGACESPPADDPGGSATADFAWRTSGTGARVDLRQVVEAYETPAGADARLADLRTYYDECGFSVGGGLEWAFEVEGIGDAAHMQVVRVRVAPNLDRYVVVRAARTGRVVTWTTFGFLGPAFGDPPAPETLGPIVDRLCGWADGTCAGEPTLVQEFPPTEPATGVLTVDDVAAVVPGSWWLAGTRPDPNTPALICSPRSLVDAGATDIASASYGDRDDPGELPLLGVWDTAATFGSPADTAQYVEDQVVGWDDCPGGAVDPVRIVPDRPAWRVDFGDHQEYYAFAQVGTHLAVVEWNSYEVDDETFLRLVDLAGARLAERD